MPLVLTDERFAIAASWDRQGRTKRTRVHVSALWFYEQNGLQKRTNVHFMDTRCGVT